MFAKFQRGGTFAPLTVNWRLSRPKSLNCSKNSFTNCAADQNLKNSAIFRLDGTVLVIAIRRYKKIQCTIFYGLSIMHLDAQVVHIYIRAQLVKVSKLFPEPVLECLVAHTGLSQRAWMFPHSSGVLFEKPTLMSSCN